MGKDKAARAAKRKKKRLAASKAKQNAIAGIPELEGGDNDFAGFAGVQTAATKTLSDAARKAKNRRAEDFVSISSLEMGSLKRLAAIDRVIIEIQLRVCREGNHLNKKRLFIIKVDTSGAGTGNCFSRSSKQQLSDNIQKLEDLLNNPRPFIEDQPLQDQCAVLCHAAKSAVNNPRGLKQIFVTDDAGVETLESERRFCDTDVKNPYIVATQELTTLHRQYMRLKEEIKRVNQVKILSGNYALNALAQGAPQAVVPEFDSEQAKAAAIRDLHARLSEVRDLKQAASDEIVPLHKRTEAHRDFKTFDKMLADNVHEMVTTGLLQQSGILNDTKRKVILNELIEALTERGYVACSHFDPEHPEEYDLSKATCGLLYLEVVLDYLQRAKKDSYAWESLVREWNKRHHRTYITEGAPFNQDFPTPSDVLATLQKDFARVESIYNDCVPEPQREGRPLGLYANKVTTDAIAVFRNGKSYFGHFYTLMLTALTQLDLDHPDGDFQEHAVEIFKKLDYAFGAMRKKSESVKLDSGDTVFGKNNKSTTGGKNTSKGSKNRSFNANTRGGNGGEPYPKNKNVTPGFLKKNPRIYKTLSPDRKCYGCGMPGVAHLKSGDSGRFTCAWDSGAPNDGRTDPKLHNIVALRRAKGIAAQSGGGNDKGKGGKAPFPSWKAKKNYEKSFMASFAALKTANLIKDYEWQPCVDCSIIHNRVSVCLPDNKRQEDGQQPGRAAHCCSLQAWKAVARHCPEAHGLGWFVHAIGIAAKNEEDDVYTSSNFAKTVGSRQFDPHPHHVNFLRRRVNYHLHKNDDLSSNSSSASANPSPAAMQPPSATVGLSPWENFIEDGGSPNFAAMGPGVGTAPGFKPNPGGASGLPNLGGAPGLPSVGSASGFMANLGGVPGYNPNPGGTPGLPAGFIPAPGAAPLNPGFIPGYPQQRRFYTPFQPYEGMYGGSYSNPSAPSSVGSQVPHVPPSSGVREGVWLGKPYTGNEDSDGVDRSQEARIQESFDEAEREAAAARAEMASNKEPWHGKEQHSPKTKLELAKKQLADGEKRASEWGKMMAQRDKEQLQASKLKTATPVREPDPVKTERMLPPSEAVLQPPRSELPCEPDVSGFRSIDDEEFKLKCRLASLYSIGDHCWEQLRLSMEKMDDGMRGVKYYKLKLVRLKKSLVQKNREHLSLLDRIYNLSNEGPDDNNPWRLWLIRYYEHVLKEVDTLLVFIADFLRPVKERAKAGSGQ